MTWLFWGLLGAIALERLGELLLSRRHQRRLLARGGRLVEDDGFGLLVALHVLWFPAMAAEFLLASWAGGWIGTWPLLGAYALAEGLRLWAIATLGDRWTTRVVVVPDEPLVDRGPYRWLRHPNYVAVTIELAALPLAFGLWATAVVATVVNAVALRRRLMVEEAALSGTAPADA